MLETRGTHPFTWSRGGAEDGSRQRPRASLLFPFEAGRPSPGITRRREGNDDAKKDPTLPAVAVIRSSTPLAFLER